VGSELWALATANAFDMLKLKECSEVAKPEWWNDEKLKALSARVVRAAPNHVAANSMRALVLSGRTGDWEVGPRLAAELKEGALGPGPVCGAVQQCSHAETPENHSRGPVPQPCRSHVAAPLRVMRVPSCTFGSAWRGVRVACGVLVLVAWRVAWRVDYVDNVHSSLNPVPEREGKIGYTK